LTSFIKYRTRNRKISTWPCLHKGTIKKMRIDRTIKDLMKKKLAYPKVLIQLRMEYATFLTSASLFKNSEISHRYNPNNLWRSVSCSHLLGTQIFSIFSYLNNISTYWAVFLYICPLTIRNKFTGKTSL
jgi:hypothetical protein